MSMFLGRRSTQAEYFDLPGRAESETIRAFQDLDRINRLFQFARPFREVLPGWLGNDRCGRFNILDIGAGTGLLGRTLSAWAAKRGWDWRFTNLDANPLGLRLGKVERSVVGSALDLPFADASFDAVIASQMTHHLRDDEVVLHLREAWRVSRDAVMISDLHRNAGLYGLLWVSTRLLRVSRSVREDALISVKRGFRQEELRCLATQAGLKQAKVWLYYGTRIILQARKRGSCSNGDPYP
jgi:ubiquinone/menaquinone biosynthesis C-methylase UbiE